MDRLCDSSFSWLLDGYSCPVHSRLRCRSLYVVEVIDRDHGTLLLLPPLTVVDVVELDC
jgi:hypothetical protein